MANFRCSGRLSAPLTMTLEHMNPKLILVLALVLSGFPLSYWWGQKVGRVAFLLACVITFAVFFLVNLCIPACIALKVCTSGGDGDLSYVFGAVLAMPGYWIAAAIGAGRKS